jgi:hypothetical protein
MKYKNVNAIKNNQVFSDYLSSLLGEIKQSSIQPLTDNEPKILQEITSSIFKKLGSDSIEATTLKELSKELFLQWRGNTEIGITIMCDFPKIKSIGSTNVTAKTSIEYGFNCSKYSDFEAKLKKVKQQQIAELA